ncbi:MAG: hypothetical protein FWG22_03205 [Prolixibacteraceae bacterium]|nr:hypothetical protein [Prolixibacteraceae bacterium]
MNQNNKELAWNAKSRGGSFGYAFFIFLIKKIGVRAAYIFLASIVVYFIPFAPKATKSIWNYNRKILKNNIIKSVSKLFLHYYRFGQTLIDKIAITTGLSSRYNFKFDNYDHFLQLLDSGQGFAMIGAHVGNWETGSAFFGDYGKRINVVMYDAEYEKIKKLLEKNKIQQPYSIIPINKDALVGILTIKSVIGRGECVCFQGDRYTDTDNVALRCFMGKEASFPTGPFLITAKLKLPAVFYFAMREKNFTYRFIFKIIEPTQNGKFTDAMSGIMDQYIETLENIIKKYPQQWFNFYNFWK